uniref:Protein phosphatase methylesterase-1 n=1 Tax=Parascaris equorum TaxID=6256 RepID=A0A914R6R4_PAREQ
WKIKRDLSPLSWDAFFDKKLTVDVGEDKFCVYVKGNTGPVFYLLHGAGYSGLTWACFTVGTASSLGLHLEENMQLRQFCAEGDIFSSRENI